MRVIRLRVIAGLVCAALVLGLCGFFLLTKTPASAAERHPKMQAALRNLEKARDNLQQANRDFKGHREKALDLTNQAIDEVRLGIESDRR